MILLPKKFKEIYLEGSLYNALGYGLYVKQSGYENRTRRLFWRYVRKSYPPYIINPRHTGTLGYDAIFLGYEGFKEQGRWLHFLTPRGLYDEDTLFRILNHHNIPFRFNKDGFQGFPENKMYYMLSVKMHTEELETLYDKFLDGKMYIKHGDERLMHLTLMHTKRAVDEYFGTDVPIEEVKKWRNYPMEAGDILWFEYEPSRWRKVLDSDYYKTIIKPTEEIIL